MVSRMKGSGKHEPPVLAIDLGGTKIYTALVSGTGQVIAREQHPTLADEGPGAVIERIVSAVDYLLSLRKIDSSQLDSISIAAAGAIDSHQGIITLSPNLLGWRTISLRDIVQDKCRVNTYLVNDANAAALGEHQCGVGRGVDNLIYLTVSTGIGGGIIINGKLYYGPNGSAGEIGHMTIDVNGTKCACGNTGCLETLASGTAVAEEAIRRIRQGERSSLTGVADGAIDTITAKEVEEEARCGDHLASDVIFKAATYLGIGLVNMVNIFNPGMIIIGGGMSKMGDMLLNPVRRIVKERAFPISAQVVRIVTAQLGEDSGVLGAAIFARQQKLE